MFWATLPGMPRNHSYRLGSPARRTASARRRVGNATTPAVTANRLLVSTYVARTTLRQRPRTSAAAMAPRATSEQSWLTEVLSCLKIRPPSGSGRAGKTSVNRKGRRSVLSLSMLGTPEFAVGVGDDVGGAAAGRLGAVRAAGFGSAEPDSAVPPPAAPAEPAPGRPGGCLRVGLVGRPDPRRRRHRQGGGRATRRPGGWRRVGRSRPGQRPRSGWFRRRELEAGRGRWRGRWRGCGRRGGRWRVGHGWVGVRRQDGVRLQRRRLGRRGVGRRGVGRPHRRGGPGARGGGGGGFPGGGGGP